MILARTFWMIKMNPVIMQMIDLALKLISDKILVFLALILTACAFSWCLYAPDILRIVSASIFGVLCLFYQRKHSNPESVKD